MSTTTTPEKYVQRNQNGSSNYYTDTYSYNPFNDKLPSTTEHWKYIKYTLKNNKTLTSFTFTKPTDAVDDNIWILYAGSGGKGGANIGGSGGGGGTGEVKMTTIKGTTFNDINCVIPSLGQPTSSTTLTTNPSTGNTAITLTSACGGNGAENKTAVKPNSPSRNGCKGGQGGGSNNNTSYDTSTITTLPFGSVGGGGGRGITVNSNKGSHGAIGDSYILTASSRTTFDYNYLVVDRVNMKNTGGVNVNFNISLSDILCDFTGLTQVLWSGWGGDADNTTRISDGPGGFIMFFYKTNNPITSNIPNTRKKINKLLQPFLNVYNYNPYTNLIPGQNVNDLLNSPGEDWVYYVYNPKDNSPFNFNHTLTDVDGSNVWILYAGPGGGGGSNSVGGGGGGGGGGPGEIVISVIPSNITNLSCYIGSLNTKTDTMDTDSNTKITYGSTTLTAKCGFSGNNGTSFYAGANGGTGGGYSGSNLTNNQVMETFDTSINTTFKFGSGYGGGGGGSNGSKNGIIGNQTILAGRTGTIFENRYIQQSDNSRSRVQIGCNVNFSVQLKSIPCDYTGTASILPGGNGGAAQKAGDNAPPGFIMIFYKTSQPLTNN